MNKIKLKDRRMNIGADPEFFFIKKAKNNKIIVGSETIIKSEKGLTKKQFNDVTPLNVFSDGVQGELRPKPTICRQTLSHKIYNQIKGILEKKEIDGITLKPTAYINKKHLNSLSEKSKILGCQPSKNIYTEYEFPELSEKDWNFRSAGGHLHFSISKQNKKMRDVENLIYLMDLMVGNTFVLLENSKQAKKRRKYYGKAGEYRLPRHGVEYRVLDNTWLKSPRLLSFAFILGRNALNIYEQVYFKNKKLFKEIIWCVKPKNVVDAINNSDKELAWKNYLIISKKINSLIDMPNLPFNDKELGLTTKFLKKIKEQGLKAWGLDTPDNKILDAWKIYSYGFESFLTDYVKKNKKQKISKLQNIQTEKIKVYESKTDFFGITLLLILLIVFIYLVFF